MRFIQRIAEGCNVIRATMKRVGADVILLYRLTEEQVPASYGRARLAYSLTVTQIDRGGRRRRVKRLRDITASRAEAVRIYKLVSRGRVFPSSVAEIVSDLISI